MLKGVDTTVTWAFYTQGVICRRVYLLIEGNYGYMKKLSWPKLEQIGKQWGLECHGCATRGRIVNDVLAILSTYKEKEAVRQLSLIIKNYSYGDKQYESKLHETLIKALRSDYKRINILCGFVDTQCFSPANGEKHTKKGNAYVNIR